MLRIKVLVIFIIIAGAQVYANDEIVFMDKNGPYTCQYTTDEIKIDGEFDEPCWKKCMVATMLIPVSGTKPLSYTEGRLLWDDKNIYVALKAWDKDIAGKYTRRDSPTYLDDVLEVFLMPFEHMKYKNKSNVYYNFEVNALEAFYDGVNNPNFSGREITGWNCKDIQIAVKIEGTLNNPDDEDKFWQLEMAVPFSSMPTCDGKVPVNGEEWKFHLARYDYSRYLPVSPELSSCAPLTKRAFHYYKDWVKLIFVSRD